ncbi:hypothetical protein Ahy_A02g009988 [Arachis hypogaea]|uniref:Protein FAR1-RELATED SEQUENCE n=1 Tax=Arachis hypogaea TaxID=3818 RepID=A0A445EJ06_ARAHY|nr:hypothetical protein Ahy_A02g009988 [Arachis hypogaea]
MKYGLRDNKWLSELFEDRHLWIPVYLDHQFWVGMRAYKRVKIMNYSSSDYQLNQSKVNYCFEYNEVPEFLCDVDEKFVPNIAMTFNTVEDAAKFYKDYSNAAESKELAVILHRAYDNAMVKMQEHKAKNNEKCSLSHEDANLEVINELQSPPRMRTR